MATKTIQISRYMVKDLLHKNLLLWQQQGRWSPTHPDRYSIQFDPTTGNYKPALFETSKGHYLDREPGWKVFMLPVPQTDFELQNMSEAISAGANILNLKDPPDEYIGEIVAP